MMMGRLALIAVLSVTLIQSYGALQVQMPETAEVSQPDDDLQSQIRDLQKNVSDIWTYIYDLRNAVSQHLTHLRTHQVALESSVHRMEHLHDGVDDSHAHHSDEHSHSTDHSHGSEHGADHHAHGGDHESDHHSHGGDHGADHHSHGADHGSDHHSHGSDHSHGGDHGSDHHSHGSDHSHGGDHGSDHHSHSGEHHSHGGDQHSHSGEHGHHSQSHSHSHSSDDHSKEHGSHSHDHSKEDSNHSHSHDSHSHSHGSDHHHDQDHKDSHETEDLSQQTQQVASDSGPVAEPVVTATSRHDHGHHDHSHGQTGRSAGGRSNSMDLMSEHSFHSHHHGRHHHHDTRSKNRTVELPKYADYNMYDFATCDVQPNRAIPVDQQQNVGGQITFWQKKSGGPLNIHVRLRGFQVGDHHGHHGAHQAVQQEEDSEVAPQEAGHKHGFHIHENGDLSNGCQSTGPHYNPKAANHGSPDAMVRHVGDLGSIECDEHGVTNIIFSDDVTSLRGQYAIYGKSAVIHADQDDKGLGGDAESLKTGNAGVRIACCLIQKVDKLPIRHYKAMKSATQYKNF